MTGDRSTHDRENQDLDALVAGIHNGDRRRLARAITLVESSLPADRRRSEDLLSRLWSARADSNDDPHAGPRTIRIGITGVPGVGKSTFIDALGTHLTASEHRVAVLAIDPSSTLSGGSILGDKTRMERLASDPRAFVRPSPGGLHPGGVARRTRETILLCEAAGFDVVLVETIGIGQSEVSVADLVDTLVLLTLTGAGDELQGIKRGIMELADVIVVHKADGDNKLAAQRTAAEHQAALDFLPRRSTRWQPQVSTCSSLRGRGLEEVFDLVQRHRTAVGAEYLAANRQHQALQGFEDTLRASLLEEFLSRPEVVTALPELRRQVRDGSLHPSAAVTRLLRTPSSE